MSEEKARKSYYRVAREKKPVGKILKGSGTPPLRKRFPEVEAILEARRPKTCVERGEGVYMKDERGFKTIGVDFDEGYVHTVEPVGTVEKRDYSWVGRLQRRHIKSAKMSDLCKGLADEEIADRYWNGAASEKPDWEYVSREAKVVSVENDPIKVRGDTPLLDMFTMK